MPVAPDGASGVAESKVEPQVVLGNIASAAPDFVHLLQISSLNGHSGPNAISIGSMTGFVNSVEFADGRLWIPERSGKVMSVSPEEQRLSEMYRNKGLNAVVEELRKF